MRAQARKPIPHPSRMVTGVTTHAGALPPETRIGAVSLNVADLTRMADFYARVVGLEELERSAQRARLGSDGRSLVELIAAPDAPPRPPHTTGLFHLAILVADRNWLGVALRRAAASRWPLSGASDHLVSEALYLGDPEGNGIEIYRDRPREDWPRANGHIQMDTLPLDLDELVDEPEPASAGPGASIGHVHLNVADIPESEAFYAGAVGMDVTVRGFPGALFLSAGGYHHHVGVNTWASAGGQPPPDGALGLRHFELLVPDEASVTAVGERLEAAGFQAQLKPRTLTAADPSGNRLLVRRVS
jgi:catechol 2,3-dioxygenase